MTVLITQEGESFEVISNTHILNEGYFSIIDRSYSCGMSKELLDIIFNNKIPNDVEKILYYIPTISGLSYSDVVMKCYCKLFSLVDTIPIQIIEDVSHIDFTDYFNRIYPHIALQIIDTTVYPVNLDKLLLEICYKDNIDLLRLIYDRVDVKDYHIRVAIKRSSVRVLRFMDKNVDYRGFDMSNKDMYDFVYSKQPKIFNYINTIEQDHVHHIKEPYMVKHDKNDLFLFLSIISNSYKFIRYTMKEGSRYSEFCLKSMFTYALERANHEVIEYLTGMRIEYYTDMKDYLFDIEAILPNAKNCYSLNFYCSITGNLDLLKLCNIEDLHIERSIVLAIENNHMNIIEYLISTKQATIYLCDLCKYKRLDMIKYLLERDTKFIDIECVKITSGCSVEILEYLLSKDININTDEYNDSNLKVIKYLHERDMIDVDSLFLKACDKLSNLRLAKQLRNICNLEDVNEDVRVVNLLF